MFFENAIVMDLVLLGVEFHLSITGCANSYTARKNTNKNSKAHYLYRSTASSYSKSIKPQNNKVSPPLL